MNENLFKSLINFEDLSHFYDRLKVELHSNVNGLDKIEDDIHDLKTDVTSLKRKTNTLSNNVDSLSSNVDSLSSNVNSLSEALLKSFVSPSIYYKAGSKLSGEYIPEHYYKDGYGIIIYDDVLKEIAPGSFLHTNLINIAIPSTITSIGNNAFQV